MVRLLSSLIIILLMSGCSQLLYYLRGDHKKVAHENPSGYWQQHLKSRYKYTVCGDLTKFRPQTAKDEHYNIHEYELKIPVDTTRGDRYRLERSLAMGPVADACAFSNQKPQAHARAQGKKVFFIEEVSL